MSSLPPPPPAPIDADTIGAVAGDRRRWGLGEMWIGLVSSNIAVLLAVGVALAVTDYADTDDFPMWVFSLINAPLHLALATVAIWAAVTKGDGPRRDFRVEFQGVDAGKGIVAGVLAQFLLVPAVTYPVLWLFDRDIDEVSETAESLSDRADTAIGVVALIITTCVVAPIVEELFFRGLTFEAYKKRNNLPWLHGAFGLGRPDTTSRRWNLTVAVVFSSAIFALVHPDPILWPALFAVGVLFALLAQRSGRLGTAIWAHVAFNATTVLSLLLLDDDSGEAIVALLPL